MPLRSVQRYVKGLIDGISIPGQQKPLQAWITPPSVENMDGPRAYVWGGHLNVTRQTMPRHAGFQSYPWTIDIWLAHLTVADTQKNPDLDDEFPQIIDTVTQVFRSTTMPVFIDADGNVEDVSAPVTDRAGLTQIQRIGERWTLDYPPEHAPATLRMVWYSALVAMEVLEVVQG